MRARGAKKSAVPYERASSGDAARGEITRMLQAFGCASVGFMDDFETGSLLLAFKHRGREVQLHASAKGWTAMWLKENPWKSRMRKSRADYEAAATRQGLMAVNSMLRDWVKGQVTAVECGMVSFEAVFLPHMITSDGRPLLERITSLDLLPPPTNGAGK